MSIVYCCFLLGSNAQDKTKSYDLPGTNHEKKGVETKVRS